MLPNLNIRCPLSSFDAAVDRQSRVYQSTRTLRGRRRRAVQAHANQMQRKRQAVPQSSAAVAEDCGTAGPFPLTRSHLNRTRRGHRCDPGDVPRNDLLRRHGLTAVRHCGIASRRSLHRVCVVHRSRCGRLGGSGSECGDGNGGRGDGNGRCHTLLKATLEIDPMRNYFHSETKGAPKP